MRRKAQLTEDLENWISKIKALAESHNLDFYDVIFEMVDYKEMNELASMGGFPQRYPHWRFGMEYDRMSKSHKYGMSKIYEMVINTNPCIAYLLTSNSLLEHKLVIAHVYGHADFFKNNTYFSHTNRKMLDQMANNSVTVRKHQEKYGIETVEEFIDCCLSLENLIDHQRTGTQFKKKKNFDAQDSADLEEQDSKKAQSYMDRFINSDEYIDKKNNQLKEEVREGEKFPAEPCVDVLEFLLEYAPLKSWQHDILELIRDEAYYFAPQGQTKIMNEGWASFWHTKMLTEEVLIDSEVIDYACVHSATMATQPGGLNPYKLGIELFRNIEERWNKGQFGKEWDDCVDYKQKQVWDLKTGQGLEKIFEVRKIYNDITFIDRFMTEDFCREQKLFSFAYNDRNQRREIESREFKKVKAQLLSQLTNFGNPFIQVVDANYKNQSALLLEHRFDGRPLKKDQGELTLKNLYKIWSKPVYIKTTDEKEGKEIIWGFDGSTYTST